VRWWSVFFREETNNRQKRCFLEIKTNNGSRIQDHDGSRKEGEQRTTDIVERMADIEVEWQDLSDLTRKLPHSERMIMAPVIEGIYNRVRADLIWIQGLPHE
jgi:hypothetical protein